MSNFKGIHNPSYRHGCNVRGNLHPLYVVWTNMKARCGHTKLSDNRVKRYYKSISVYKEWLSRVGNRVLKLIARIVRAIIALKTVGL